MGGKRRRGAAAREVIEVAARALADPQGRRHVKRARVPRWNQVVALAEYIGGGYTLDCRARFYGHVDLPGMELRP